ncbi:hypothetical protein GKZ28_00765 [Clostridium chromiireducens]|uniref:Uncharacterized protein n=1 Tax=Clostridium chromiireducens TaxID=225345 RepID=A0A964RIP3_9CLOT|nr:hypothetical protein [Clostridium chromiireducens]MVX62231.1 hypothetical protein [Clostridium chromiireducens]
MALSKNIIKTVWGKDIEFENAYIQITNIVGNKDQVTLSITIYDSSSKQYIIGTDNYTFIPSSDLNSLRWDKQGYEQLKTNKYTDAIDILDEGQTA